MQHILAPVYRWANWRLERWSNQLKVTQQARFSARIWTQQCMFRAQDLKNTTVILKKYHHHHPFIRAISLCFLKEEDNVSVTLTTSLSSPSSSRSRGRIRTISPLKAVGRESFSLANTSTVVMIQLCKENLSDQNFSPQLQMREMCHLRGEVTMLFTYVCKPNSLDSTSSCVKLENSIFFLILWFYFLI